MKPFSLSLFCLTLFTSTLCAGTGDDVIRRARAWVGDEAALDGVRSIRFIGRIEFSANPTEKGLIELIFQKPLQHRMTVTIGGIRETTALDEFEGWIRRQRLAEPDWTLTLLSADLIRQMQAQVAESLHFFTAAKMRGGRIDYLGEEDYEGVRCDKIAFHHPGARRGNITFIRYFDKATGRLVASRTAQDIVVREEGEKIVGGLRFPRTIVNVFPDGSTNTVVFEEILLNETFPAEEFRMPMLAH